MYAIINAQLALSQLTSSQKVQDLINGHALLIKEELIADILPQEQLNKDIKTIDAQGLLLCPAFIDLQINGCAGKMFNDTPSLECLEAMLESNLATATACFLPTLITDSDAKIQQAIEAITLFKQKHPYMPGLHLEGPWLNPEKKGVHSQAHIRSPNQKILQLLCENASNIAMLTLAPEMVDEKVIQILCSKGIKIALGHSNASYEQALKAFAAGASISTHLFNAMSALQGREPGLVGASLEQEEIYCGIIADGLHVHPRNIALSHKLKGNKLCLVTDATAAANANIKAFNFVQQTVYVDEQGKCYNKDGTLGGSSLSMLQAVQYCYQHVGLPLSECLKMATSNPAEAIGIEHQMGIIKAGALANIAALKIDKNKQIDLAFIIKQGLLIS